MDEKDIQELIRRLNDRDPYDRSKAAKEFAGAAWEGHDITPAIPALVNALSDENDDVRKDAAGAFTTHYGNKENWKKLGELLGHENEYVREGAARALKEAADVDQDITPAVPALGKALSDKRESARRWAAEMLANAAFEGLDITPAIPALANALSDEHKDVRRNAAWALGGAAYAGQDITPAIPALVNALRDKDDYIRTAAAIALGEAAEKGQDITLAIPALINALSDKSKDCRTHGAEALAYFAKGCKSIEKLDEIQKAFENSFVEWSRKQPQGISKEKIEKQIETSQLLMDISDKKAELSKKEGELLLGETVKKPSDSGKKIYQSLRRVSRNG